MSFKENLLKKIRIDTLAETVIDAYGPPGSGGRIDKDVMRLLLDIGGFQTLKERDLDLYILEGDETKGKILVLDNDLAVYHTSAADVGMRKSPVVKEMLTISSIKKILNDKDVVLSKKDISVRTVQNRCLDMLDLSFTASDIDALAREGVAAIESGDAEGVLVSLTLFSELLDYRSAPKPFHVKPYRIMGKCTAEESGGTRFGPMIIFDPAENIIKWVDTQFGSLDKAEIEHLHQVAKGKETATAEGPAVFQILKESVLI